jgi:hypothetical protein
MKMPAICSRLLSAGIKVHNGHAGMNLTPSSSFNGRIISVIIRQENGILSKKFVAYYRKNVF